MSSGDTLLSARLVGPEMMQQGRDNVLKCPVYRDGTLQVPSAYTLAIYRPDGTTFLSPSVTIPGNIATATVGSGFLATESFGMRWNFEWTLTIGGIVYTFRRAGGVCKRQLYPVITDADLTEGRFKNLARFLPTGVTTFQGYSDEAWRDLVHDLEQKGNLAHLIMSPEDLRFVHLWGTLEGFFADCELGGGDVSVWTTRREQATAKRKAEFDKLTFLYDAGEDGVADEERRPAQPVTFLGSSGYDPTGYGPGGPWPL